MMTSEIFPGDAVVWWKYPVGELLPLAGLVLVDLLWYHWVDNALKVGKLLSDHSLIAGRHDDSRRQLLTCQWLGSAVVLRGVASQRSKVDPNENVFQVGLSFDCHVHTAQVLTLHTLAARATCSFLINLAQCYTRVVISNKMTCHIQVMFASSRLKIFFGFTLFK